MSQHKGLSVNDTIGKGSVTGKVSQSLDQLISDMTDINMDSVWESGWELIARESKNQTASSNAKSWGSSTATPCDSTGSQPETREKNSHASALEDSDGAGNQLETQEKNDHASDLEDSVGASDHNSDNIDQEPDDCSYDDDDELLDDFDYDLTVDYYSDESEKSHEMRKKNKWLKPFFDTLDDLKDEQINDPNRRWHCPACHDGPGAIGWYKGLLPLLTHAKTRGSLRIKLHREFAEVLEEEILRRGTSVILAGELLGKWKGLGPTTVDHEIVWPPMVVIMNTLCEKDEDDKWIGMGNQELIDYFSNYAAVRARHSYGPNGHRGMSVLIFEASVMGYVEAERLHKQFACEGRDRDAWGGRRVLFYPGGKRQLYGFLASKEDMDIFNQHSTGRSLLKFEMKSYLDMVVVPLRQMMEDNQKLMWYKNKAIKQGQHYEGFEERFAVASEKLREILAENRIVRLRTKMQCEENKEEMDYQESFFREQMERIRKVGEEREQELEKLLQKERAKANKSGLDSVSNESCKQREEETENFISSQAECVEELEAEREKLIQVYKQKKDEMKCVKELEAEREKLIRVYKQKKDEMKRMHLEEEIELNKEFDAALTKLMDRCTLPTFQPSKIL